MIKYAELNINQIICNKDLSYNLKKITNYHSEFIFPLLVHESKEKFLLVDGFSRYYNLQNQNKSNVPVYISDQKYLELSFKEGIKINNNYLPYSIAEQVLILKTLKIYFEKNIETISNEYQNQFQIPLKKEFDLFYEKIFLLDRDEFALLHALNPSFKQVRQLFSYPIENIKEWFKLHKVLDFKLKDGLFILDNLFRIEKSGGNGLKVILSVIDEQPLSNLVGEKRVNALKQKLQSQNFPEYSRKYEEIRTFELQLKKNGFGIGYDKNLESNNIQINFSCSSPEQFEKKISDLNTSSVKDIVNEMFKVIKKG